MLLLWASGMDHFTAAQKQNLLFYQMGISLGLLRIGWSFKMCVYGTEKCPGHTGSLQGTFKESWPHILYV